MADITVTPANVKLGSTSTTYKRVQYGETVAQGKSVYLKASDNKWWLADSNALESAGSGGVGIAITPGVADEYQIIATGGLVNCGATLVPGMAYFVSNTAGGIIPAGDLSSTEYTTYLGAATSAALLNMQPHASGGLTT
jgi:hypothetical protein